MTSVYTCVRRCWTYFDTFDSDRILGLCKDSAAGGMSRFHHDTVEV